MNKDIARAQVLNSLNYKKKNRLFRQGMVVVDLGASPGGWSQMVANWVGEKGMVIALDRLPMPPLPGVVFIEGDFNESESLELLEKTLQKKTVEWLLSDMAPNVSGVRDVDQSRMMGLAELAWDFAMQHSQV